jgi:hypothetical protein
MTGKKKKKQKNIDPKNLDELKNGIFQKIYRKFRNFPILLKVFIIMFLLCLSTILARLNVFGEPLYKFSKIIIPIYIDKIDSPNFIIPIYLSLSKENSLENNSIKNGDSFFSGEKIKIKFSSGKDCWLSFFCIDFQGIHYLFQGTLDPSFINEKSEYSFDFILDDIEGIDIFYIVACENKFIFDKDVKPKIMELFPSGNSKGVNMGKYFLNLPHGFSTKNIYINHLSNK